MTTAQLPTATPIGSVGVTAGEVARLSVVRYRPPGDAVARPVRLELRELRGATVACKPVLLEPGTGDYLDWCPVGSGRMQIYPVIVISQPGLDQELGATFEIVQSATMVTRLSLAGVCIETASAGVAREAVLRRSGTDVWTIERSGRTAHLKSTKGLTQLAALLSAPGQEIASTLLAGGPDTGESLRTEVLDNETRAAYRRRLAQLDEIRRSATAAGDAATEARVEQEQDALVAELRRLTGLGGRSRTFTDEDERARVNVTRTLRAAVERIFECDPDLGVHLAQSIRTGSRCVYAPADDATRWAISVQQ